MPLLRIHEELVPVGGRSVGNMLPDYAGKVPGPCKPSQLRDIVHPPVKLKKASAKSLNPKP